MESIDDEVGEVKGSSFWALWCRCRRARGPETELPPPPLQDLRLACQAGAVEVVRRLLAAGERADQAIDLFGEWTGQPIHAAGALARLLLLPSHIYRP